MAKLAVKLIVGVLLLLNVDTCFSAGENVGDSKGTGVGQVLATRKNDVLEELREKLLNWYTAASKWYVNMNSWRSKAMSMLEQELDPDDEYEDGDSDADLGQGSTKKMEINCNQIIKLTNGSSVEFYSPFFYSARAYPNRIRCEYSIFGDTDCQPVVSCPVFDIRKYGPDCKKEYFKLQDGLGNSVRFCGKEGPFINTRSPVGLRDLFVVFVSGKDDDDSIVEAAEFEHDGFLCTARCRKAGDEVIDGDRDPRLLKRKKLLYEDRCFCGMGTDNTDRIVGGQSATRGAYPWQAALVQKGTRTPFCGGTLINDKFILTASHCFPPGHDTSVEKNIQVLLSAHVLESSQLGKVNYNATKGEKGWVKSAGWDLGVITDADENTQRLAVKEIITHPLFINGQFDYDVALLRLAGRIKFTDANSPVPVCLPELGKYALKDINATVVGWGLGHEKAATTTRILQELSVPLLDINKCKMWLPRNSISNRMICAGFREGRQDACKADSGGPLMKRVNERFWEQIGVVSWGVGCAKRKKPGFYSKITEMNQWLHQVSNSRGARWCLRQGDTRKS